MAVIAITLPNSDMTGASRMALAYATALRRSGHEIVALCGPPPGGQPSVIDPLREAGIQVFVHPRFGGPFRPAVLRWVIGTLRQARSSAVVTFFVTKDTKYAALAARWLGIPHVASVQNDIRFYGGRGARFLKRIAFQLIFRHGVDRAVCPSRPIERQLLERFGVPAERVIVLPNTIDTRQAVFLSHEDRQAARRSLGLMDDEIVGLNVGRLDQQKGQLVLVEACKKVAGDIPRLRLLLAGGTTIDSLDSEKYKTQLEMLAASSGLTDRVQFLGWRNDIPWLNAVADFYVHTALWEGGWSLAVLEAMAAGKPVIYTDCAGELPGFREGENGFMVAAGSADGLASGLRRLLALPEAARVEMGQRNRALAGSRYDTAAVTGEFVRTVEELLARPPARLMAV